MKDFFGVAALCSSMLIAGVAFAGSYQSERYGSGYGDGHRSKGYYQAGREIVSQPRAPHPSHSIGVRIGQSGYHGSSQTYSPGRVQQRPERRYEQRLPRGHQQRFQKPLHQQRNPSVQPGNSRAGENQFGSGNTQMPRPPQMNQPGPAGQSGQGYHGPQQRYGR